MKGRGHAPIRLDFLKEMEAGLACRPRLPALWTGVLGLQVSLVILEASREGRESLCRKWADFQKREKQMKDSRRSKFKFGSWGSEYLAQGNWHSKWQPRGVNPGPLASEGAFWTIPLAGPVTEQGLAWKQGNLCGCSAKAYWIFKF